MAVEALQLMALLTYLPNPLNCGIGKVDLSLSPHETRS
jgi:hypothetical protein